jgi:DNA-binding NtrC family response regulator
MATRLASTDVDLSITLPNPRVLVLDDDRYYSEAVAKNLELLGADVFIASSTAEAKNLLEQQSFQVIITDIFLDGDRNTGDEFIVHNSQGSHEVKHSGIGAKLLPCKG